MLAGTYGQAEDVPVDWDIWTGYGCTCRLGHMDRLGVYMQAQGVPVDWDIWTGWGCTCKLRVYL